MADLYQPTTQVYQQPSPNDHHVGCLRKANMETMPYYFKILLALTIAACCSCHNKIKTNAYVKVVAHRGDWRNAPENSLQGVLNCMDMGVDMVEVDLSMTKDSVLILMHDETLDRTTNASGRVSDWTYADLKDVHLKTFDGRVTDQTIPTLHQLLELTKGKIEVFLDKGYGYIPQAYAILEAHGVAKEVHFLGFVSGHQLIKDYPILSQHISYMPLVLPVDTLDEQLASYDKVNVTHYLYSFREEHSPQLSTITTTAKDGIAMATTQVDDYCAGHSDSLSLTAPDLGWGWIVDQGFNAICTDFPKELISYLKKRELR